MLLPVSSKCWDDRRVIVPQCQACMWSEKLFQELVLSFQPMGAGTELWLNHLAGPFLVL